MPVSAEAYSWLEGNIFVYTGTATASATVAYAQNTNLVLQRGWNNRAAIDSTYRDVLTGKRANLSVAAMLSFANTLARFHESATAVHVKLLFSSINGSAGYVLFSGRIDSLTQNGNDGGIYNYTMQYHANSWSAF